MTAGNDSPVSLRLATPDDADASAGLIYSTMVTLGEYLFGQPDAQRTIRAIAVLFRERKHLLSYQFSTLAEAKKKTVGIVQAFPGAFLGRASLELVRACGKCFGLRGALRLIWRGLPLAFEPDAEPGEYYVNTLSVAPDQRNQGIGRILLAEAERQAKESNFPFCSLGVLLQNADAKRFYERAGYREEAKILTNLHAPGVQYNGFYRMIKNINGGGSAAKGAPTK